MDTKDRPREKVALVINDGLLKAKRIIVRGIENLGDPTAQKINYLRNYFLLIYSGLYYFPLTLEIWA